MLWIYGKLYDMKIQISIHGTFCSMWISKWQYQPNSTNVCHWEASWENHRMINRCEKYAQTNTQIYWQTTCNSFVVTMQWNELMRLIFVIDFFMRNFLPFIESICLFMAMVRFVLIYNFDSTAGDTLSVIFHVTSTHHPDQ